MKKTITAVKGLLFLVICLGLSGYLGAQVVVQAPAAQDVVKSCQDYAEQVLQDRWDMNERTDLGWRTFNTLENPKSWLGNISFTGGIFSAKSVASSSTNPDSSDAKVFILDSAYPGSAMLGKIGTNFPIDAGKYTHLVMRVSLGPDAAGPFGQLIWSKNTIYYGVTTSGAFIVHNGWAIYIIDIPSLGRVAGDDPWAGLIDSLRLDPVTKKDKTVKIDWIRLVRFEAAQRRTITWNGSAGNVDIYLDNNANPADGNLGLLAANVAGNSYPFLTGGLSHGDYYAVVAPTGTAAYSYSPGYYRVTSTPVINITKPSVEGDDSDYVTMAFNDPWDMNNAADVERFDHVQASQFKSINYEDLAGRAFVSQKVFFGKSVAAVPPSFGDPMVYFLDFLNRGKAVPIDTSRYHNLTFKMSLDGTQSVADGSIARVVWKRNDEPVENVTQDIIIRHLGDRWIMNKIVLDLRTIPLEAGLGSPSHSGWTGMVDGFRIDPHEFSDPRNFVFDDVKITGDWTADKSFAIEGALDDADGAASLSFYYDTDNSGFDGTLIVGNLAADQGQIGYNWKTQTVPAGTYWIYAVVDDGMNQNRSYSGGPVIVNHSYLPQIALSGTHLNFGAQRNGATTNPEKVLVTNSGLGTLNWQASANKSWIILNRTTGTGDGVLEVSVKAGSMPAGKYSGTVTITDPQASNSPQTISVNLTVYSAGADAAPFGRFDSPKDQANVSSSIPVTGWVLDDIETKRIQLKRAPVATDPGGVIDADGLVYIGDAIFVAGARPDVEASYPDYPLSDRAGWGYMLLTNFLPNGGNGTFSLHAIAQDGSGHTVNLGSKEIHCDNAHAVKPFGAIDTPLQGGPAAGAAFVNFGWALTPQPKHIPADGSSIWVWVDGVPLGHPVYNNYRADIATMFPGYANANGAVGYFYLDTTTFVNGVHTIAWSVADNDGASDGIGSRYFNIQNVSGTQGRMAPAGLAELPEDATGRLGLKIVGLETGYSRKAVLTPGTEGRRELAEFTEDAGLPEALQKVGEGYFILEIAELERIELRFKNRGGQVVGWGQNPRKPLPVGSFLNGEEGVFTWSPGPGFLGEHLLHFAVTDGQSLSRSVEMVVRIRPRTE